MSDRRLYEKLQSRKDNGEELDFERITYKELYQLWWEECVADSIIGNLYNVAKDVVRKKRYKLGLKQNELVATEIANKIISHLDYNKL